jgi:hypothetical protein
MEHLTNKNTARVVEDSPQCILVNSTKSETALSKHSWQRGGGSRFTPFGRKNGEISYVKISPDSRRRTEPPQRTSNARTEERACWQQQACRRALPSKARFFCLACSAVPSVSSPRKHASQQKYALPTHPVGPHTRPSLRRPPPSLPTYRPDGPTVWSVVIPLLHDGCHSIVTTLANMAPCTLPPESNPHSHIHSHFISVFRCVASKPV